MARLLQLVPDARSWKHLELSPWYPTKLIIEVNLPDFQLYAEVQQPGTEKPAIASLFLIEDPGRDKLLLRNVFRPFATALKLLHPEIAGSHEARHPEFQGASFLVAVFKSSRITRVWLPLQIPKVVWNSREDGPSKRTSGPVIVEGSNRYVVVANMVYHS